MSQTTTASAGATRIWRSNSSPIAGQVISPSALRPSSSANAIGGEGRTVEPPVGVEDPVPEALHQGGERRLAGLDDGAGDLVGVDDHRALGPQEIGDRRLARADPPGESHEQHCAPMLHARRFAH